MRDLLLAVRLVLGGWTLILAILLIAAGLTLAGLLVWRLWRGHREEVAYEDDMVPYVDDQQTAVGRVAVPQPVHPRTAARIEQARQESPSAEVYELTEREWADHIAAHPLDGRSFDCFPDCDCMPAAHNRPPFGIARYVPQQRDGGA